MRQYVVDARRRDRCLRPRNLATAYVLFRYFEPDARQLAFDTLGGRLTVTREGNLLEERFPAYELTPAEVTNAMERAFGARPEKAYPGCDLLCVFTDASTVRSLDPDQERLALLDGLLQHATAPGDVAGMDCVSRSFAPKLSVAEDPVCGSGHCHIAPYWAARLGKDRLVAYQASRRGGTLRCRLEGGSVCLAGGCVLYAVAETTI